MPICSRRAITAGPTPFRANKALCSVSGNGIRKLLLSANETTGVCPTGEGISIDGLHRPQRKHQEGGFGRRLQLAAFSCELMHVWEHCLCPLPASQKLLILRPGEGFALDRDTRPAPTRAGGASSVDDVAPSAAGVWACSAIGREAVVEAASLECLNYRAGRFHGPCGADRGTSPLPQGPAMPGREPSTSVEDSCSTRGVRHRGIFHRYGAALVISAVPVGAGLPAKRLALTPHPKAALPWCSVRQVPETQLTTENQQSQCIYLKTHKPT